MSKKRQNDAMRDSASRIDRRQFLGAGAALGAAGMGVMFSGLTRDVLAQNAHHALARNFRSRWRTVSRAAR